MKKIILFMLLACMLAGSMLIQPNKKLQDGLYLVDKVLYDTNSVTQQPHQGLVFFNHSFIENTPGSAIGLIVNTADFVPLLLEDEPLLIPQGGTNKKLQLTFTGPAAEKLEHFSGRNIMKQAALVVNGEALTMHKIRDKIQGGKMEITGNSDNALQQIYVTLKNNVTGKK